MTERRAVLFDLDGTLYEARPLRIAMLLELARVPLSGPRRAVRTLRHLKTFRSVREELRDLGSSAESLEEEQYAVPAARLGEDPGALRETVEEWIHRRPLRHLGAAAWPMLAPTLGALRDSGLSLGVFSDYPPHDKLVALGVREYFDAVVSATDPAVNAFKPHPRGFQVGAEALGCDPREVLYVGDRVDVDAYGARAAGLECVIVGHSEEGAPDGCRFVSKFANLADAILR